MEAQRPSEPPKPPKQSPLKFVPLFFMLIVLASGAFALYKFIPSFLKNFPRLTSPKTSPSPKTITTISSQNIKAFDSKEEFIKYLKEGGDSEASFSLGNIARSMTPGLEDLRVTSQEAPMPEAGGGAPDRVSETNVQVLGIDEPDIVKTDGKEIYFSPLFYGFRHPIPLLENQGIREKSIFPPPELKRNTKVIKAFPPTDLKEQASIDKNGNLLLQKNNLIIFSQSFIYGYDVSNPSSPEEKWKIELESTNQVVTSRLYKGKVYLITQSRINRENPCPIKPLTINGSQITIHCANIYHPKSPVFIDSTFTVMTIDPATGQVEKNVSFVGTSSSSIVYMSQNSVFITYTYQKDLIKFLFDFFSSKAKNLISENSLQRLEKLKDYEISQQAKMTEYQVILAEYRQSLGDDEKLQFDNELNNLMEEYAKEHSREIQETGIMQISVPDLQVGASGAIPGRPLNQFSLDEYQNHLRIATTVGDSWTVFGRGQSANDLYILDDNLKIVGEIKDLGLTERIYSARFIEDKGYLVTFRKIDPFYVFDLSDPKNPLKKGELKIPGYSSYLHPIDKDTILGIGEEQNKVKISLFDVSDPSNPQEVDKYTLDEYWSEVSQTHHAFLMDSKHQVFFLPGNKGGYIFSYKSSKLKLEKAISNIQAKRAIYIDDYMYIIGETSLVVLDENTWQEINKIDY